MCLSWFYQWSWTFQFHWLRGKSTQLCFREPQTCLRTFLYPVLPDTLVWKTRKKLRSSPLFPFLTYLMARTGEDPGRVAPVFGSSQYLTGCYKWTRQPYNVLLRMAPRPSQASIPHSTAVKPPRRWMLLVTGKAVLTHPWAPVRYKYLISAGEFVINTPDLLTETPEVL